MFTRNRIFSTLIFLLCAATISVRVIRSPMHSAISWDVFGYYLYLPALFYHDDLALKDVQFAHDARNNYDLSNTLYQVHEMDGGHRVIQYTCGYAIISLPAFAAGHFIAGKTGQAQDGFSMPYQQALVYWMLFICIIGLFFLQKILRHYFDDSLAAILIALLLLATNYYEQVVHNLTTQHGLLFTIQAMLIWFIIQWNETRKGRYLIIISTLFGLGCLVRPTEGILGLLIFFWGSNGLKSAFSNWFDIFRKHPWVMLGSAAIVMCCAMPQLIYWKVATGHFFTNSYANHGEGLDFLTPHTWSFLFSFRKGWFVYTPIMLLAVVGLIRAYRTKRDFAWAAIIFFVINIYIASSWTTWWYAGSFSQRTMVQTYPLMMVLIGITIHWLSALRFYKWVCWSLVSLFAFLNVFQSWQYENKILDSSRMTKAAYFNIFLKTERPQHLDELLMIDRGTSGIPVNQFPEKYTSIPVMTRTFFEETDSIFVMKPEDEFYNIHKTAYRDLTIGEHCWVDIDVEVFCDSILNDELLIVAAMEHKGNYGYTTQGFTKDTFKPGEWNTLHMSYLTPPVRNTKDLLATYLWKRKNWKVLIRKIEVNKQVLKNETEYNQ